MVYMDQKYEDHGIPFHYFMENAWRNNENSDGFIILGSKITRDSDCSCEKKRCWSLEDKAMKSLDSILKS